MENTPEATINAVKYKATTSGRYDLVTVQYCRDHQDREPHDPKELYRPDDSQPMGTHSEQVPPESSIAKAKSSLIEFLDRGDIPRESYGKTATKISQCSPAFIENDI